MDGGPAFCETRHVAFIQGLMAKSDSFEHVVMEHLKVRPDPQLQLIDRFNRPPQRFTDWLTPFILHPSIHPLLLQMSAVYWALMGMALMGRDLEAEMDLGKIVEWVLKCQHPNGGYASTH